MVIRESITVGLLGLGTVGSGVVEILRRNGDAIREKTGSHIRVTKALVRDVTGPRSVDLEGIQLTSDPGEILQDPDIDVVVEVMGGLDKSRQYIEEALRQGKFVVTANKDLLAQQGADLMQLAQECGKNIYYEASVGGGIPLIRPLKHSLAANRIMKVMGIINGTTNYILTQMTLNKKEFSVALREAKEKGFAEQDPTSDLEGRDAAYKLAILATNAFHSKINMADVYVEGISRINLRDILYAAELGYVVKLLAIGEEKQEGLSLRVHPSLISSTHPLAGVYDEFNAVFIEGDAVGEVMFFGRGAGSLPTGSAVVADIIDVVRNINHQVSNGVLEVNFKEKKVIPMEEQCSRFYLRLATLDEPGVFAELATAFGEEGVSLDMILQKHIVDEIAEIVLVTNDVKEKQFNKSLARIKALPALHSIDSILRVV